MVSLKFHYVAEIMISVKCLFHMLHSSNLFVDNVAVSRKDLWTDRIHLLESDKTAIAKNLISTFKRFSFGL